MHRPLVQILAVSQKFIKSIFSERKMNEVQPQVGAFGDMGNLVNSKVQSGVDSKHSLSKQVDLEEKENIEQPIRKKKTRGTRGGKKLREKRELRELRERNRKLGKVRFSTNFKRSIHFWPSKGIKPIISGLNRKCVGEPKNYNHF